MADVYITGASGVLGAELTLHLMQDTGSSLRAVSRKPCPLLPTDHPAQIIVDSLFDANWFTHGHRQATILHCAGLSDPRQHFPSVATLTQDHIQPHIAMIEALLTRGWRGRLIFLSSGGTVYGNPLRLPIPETHPTAPISHYGLHKLLLEHAMAHLAITRGFELIILRVSNPYGSTLTKPNQGVIPILFRAYHTDSLFQIIGDGAALRDYLHITDLCRAVSLCLNHQMQTPVLTLNIGSGTGTTLAALITLIGDLTHQRLRTRHIPAIHDVHSNVLCNRRAETVLGWQPQVPLREGLHRHVTRGDPPAL